MIFEQIEKLYVLDGLLSFVYQEDMIEMMKERGVEGM